MGLGPKNIGHYPKTILDTIHKNYLRKFEKIKILISAVMDFERAPGPGPGAGRAGPGPGRARARAGPMGPWALWAHMSWNN